MNYVIEYVRALPFAQAVVIATAAAFVCAVLVGVSVTRLRRGRGAGRRKPAGRAAPPREAVPAPRGELGPEFSTTVQTLFAATERLDRAIANCLELSGRLSFDDVNPSGAAVGPGVDDPAAGLGERIRAMNASGVDRGDIARELNMSNELLELYMHVGNRGGAAPYRPFRHAVR